MTDKQVIDYLYKHENYKTYAQIIKATGRSYEELKQIYNDKVLPLVREKEFSRETNTGEKYIRQLPSGNYCMSYPQKKIYGTFQKIEDAIKARDEAIGRI